MRNLANYEKAANCTPSDRINVIHSKKRGYLTSVLFWIIDSHIRRHSRCLCFILRALMSLLAIGLSYLVGLLQLFLSLLRSIKSFFSCHAYAVTRNG